MPTIQPYEQQIAPQGFDNSQASPSDFDTGRGLMALGQGAMSAASDLHQMNETQDVTNAHVQLAKDTAYWEAEFRRRQNEAQPGDDTFVPKFAADMQAYFDKNASAFSTRAGSNTYAVSTARLSAEFQQKGGAFQAELAAQDATNKYGEMLKSYGSAAYNDQTMLPSLKAQAMAAIDDPKGMFARIPQTARDKLKIQFENDLNFAAARGFVRHSPGALLQSIAPDLDMKFQPYQRIVQSNAVPGGQPSISKGAMQWAPQVSAAGAAKNVNPNILLAQIDAESGGNPKARNDADAKVTGSASIGIAQFQPGTAAQYGIDPTKPDQAIKGQAAYMADLLAKYGGDYSKALAAYNWGPGNLDKALQRFGPDFQPHLPISTQQYVAKIMANAGAVAVNPEAPPALEGQQPVPEPAAAADRTPTTISALPAFNSLSWEQQDQVVHEAVQLQHMQLTMAERQRADAERVLKENQKQVMDGYLGRIIDPTTVKGPLPDNEIMNDHVLDWQQKQHLIDYKITRQRELAAMAESKTNPAEVRRLMLEVHAADDDPTKTYNMDPVMESYRNGRISTAEMKFLRTEVEQMRDGTGNSFMKQVQSAREVVYTSLTRSIQGQIQPEVAADAAYRFNQDLQKAIEDKRKKNENPATLLDPNSREYVLKPERIQAYMMGSKANLAKATGVTVDQNKAALPKVASDADFDKLPKGASFVDPQGNVRVKP